MSFIANLAVALTASTGQFTSKMRGASKAVQSFSSTVSGLASGTTAKLTGLFAAVTGVGSVAALYHFTKQAMETIDTTAKLADRLASTTEGLIGLQHAADLGGSSAETLNASLDKLTKNLGVGGSAVEDALKTLGLTRQGLLGKGAVEQFTTIAEAIKGLQSAEARAAVTTQLFGKTGQELSAVLALGRDGLKQATEEAAKLGIAFSRVDAFQVEAANDAATRLGATLRGAFMQLGVVVAPIMEAISNKLTDIATKGGGVGEVVRKAFEGLITLLDGVVTSLGDVVAAVARVGAGLLDLSPTIRKLFPFTASVVDKFTRREGATDEEINAVAASAADRLRGVSDRVLASTGPGAISGLVNPIMEAARKKAQEDAAKQEAANARSERFRDAAQPFVDAIYKGLASGVIGDLFKGAGDQAIQDRIAKSLFRNQLSNAFNPALEFAAGNGFESPTRVAQISSAGTRGTFAAENASRQTASYTIQQQQLDALNDIRDGVQDLNENFADGVPVG